MYERIFNFSYSSAMHTGNYVFTQLTQSFSRHLFQRCVDRYQGDYYVKAFPCWQQLLCLCFGQLSFRESLRSIVVSLNVHPKKLYHLGFRAPVRRSTLAHANDTRDWRIYQEFGMILIKKARALYRDDASFLTGLKGTYYALDATTIDLCLSVFQWAHFREHKGAVKLHTLLDLRGSIPSFIHITDGTVHDVNVLDVMAFEPEACYVMDRGYVDYARLYRIHVSRAYFITRAKRSMCWKRIYSNPVDRTTGLICDQTIRLTSMKGRTQYPETLRRVKYHDMLTDNTYVFLTNNTTLSALQIAELYKRRWDIELFFKWVKGHLKIKVFWGESENAVKTQIWVAVCSYIMVAIAKKELKIERSMYEMLQILSTTIFEKTPMAILFSKEQEPMFSTDAGFQLKLPCF